jgi:hypothetical protein
MTGFKVTEAKHFHFVASFQTRGGIHILMLRPLIKPISTCVYTSLVRIKLLPPLPSRINPRDLEAPSDSIRNLPSEDPFTTTSKDSDRRKALALQALHERLEMKQMEPKT